MSDTTETKRQVTALMKGVMRYGGVSYRKLAEMISTGKHKTTKQSLNRMVNCGSMKLVTFLQILDVLGMKCRIERNGTMIYEMGDDKHENADRNTDKTVHGSERGG